MIIRDYDRRLLAFCRRASKNVAAFAPSEPDSIEVCALAKARFERAADWLEQHIERAKTEGVEAGEADQRFDAALNAANQSYSNIFKGLMAAFLVREASGTASSDSHIKTLKVYLEGRTASSFAQAAEDDKVSLMSGAVVLADRFTGGLLAPEVLDQARQDAADLKRAWENLLDEQAERSAADRDLRTASAQSTRDYRGARPGITGFLRDAEQSARLAMIVPSLKDISSSRSTSPENSAADAAGDAPADAPADAPDEEPAPLF